MEVDEYKSAATKYENSVNSHRSSYLYHPVEPRLPYYVSKSVVTSLKTLWLLGPGLGHLYPYIAPSDPAAAQHAWAPFPWPRARPQQSRSSVQEPCLSQSWQQHKICKLRVSCIAVGSSQVP